MQLIAGELSTALLELLSSLSNEVFLPFISSTSLSLMPQMVLKSIGDGIHKLTASGGRAFDANCPS